MRIVENSPSRLVLRDRTLWISWICLAAAAVIALRFAIDRAGPGALIPGLLFLAFGVAFLRATDVTLDKARGNCALHRRDILRVTRKDIAFGDIIDVRVEPSPGGDDPAAPNCRLSLVAASAVIPLSAAYEPSLQRYTAMRQELLDVLFVNRPQPLAPDPVELLVSAGRPIDAVMLVRQRDGLDLTTARARVAEMRKALHA